MTKKKLIILLKKKYCNEFFATITADLEKNIEIKFLKEMFLSLNLDKKIVHISEIFIVIDFIYKKKKEVLIFFLIFYVLFFFFE